jgi:hypothetical protein
MSAAFNRLQWLSYAGREIWQQTRGKLHAFVSGAGTGGTIAGVSKALKDLNPSLQVVLADPQGSSLFNKVRHHTHNNHKLFTYVGTLTLGSNALVYFAGRPTGVLKGSSLFNKVGHLTHNMTVTHGVTLICKFLISSC